MRVLLFLSRRPDLTASLRICPYEPADRTAIRDICVRTCWMGEYRPEFIGDDWLWAEYWTRYFTDAEPCHTWVVRREAAVVGYLTGTCDVRRFDAYVLRLMPRIVFHVIRRRLLRKAVPRRALLAMLKSTLRGELALPEHLARAYPATWHFDLLPEGRGSGIGRGLFDTFLQAMRACGAPGVHSQAMSINPVVNRFITKAGFTLVEAHPIRAFEHVHPEPILLNTYVMKL